MRRFRSTIAVLATTATLLGLGLLAPRAAFAVSPALTTPGLARNCQGASPNFSPSGFLDNANGQTVSLEFTAPDGSTWATSSSFTPNSDHYDLSQAGPLTLQSAPQDAFLWSTAMTVTLSVKDASDAAIASAEVSVNACAIGLRIDFDGDGLDDIAVFRPTNGTWYVNNIATAAYSDTFHNVTVPWGTKGDIPVPADYNQDGVTDFAVFRPSNGNWYFRGGSTIHFGQAGDIPVPGFYDFTLRLAVFRPSNGKWYVLGGSTVAWGTKGDVPVPGDYNGNGDEELTVFRPSTGSWYNYDVSPHTVAWGTNGDIPVPSDYTNDGFSEIAVFRPSNGTWYLQDIDTVRWGTSGDIPAPTDYDGDGFADLTVFRPSNGTWYIQGFPTIHWGTNGDIPIQQVK